MESNTQKVGPPAGPAGRGGAVPGLPGCGNPTFYEALPRSHHKSDKVALWGPHWGPHPLLRESLNPEILKVMFLRPTCTVVHSLSDWPALVKGFWSQQCQGTCPGQTQPPLPMQAVCHSAALLGVWSREPWDSWHSCRGWSRKKLFSK